MNTRLYLVGNSRYVESMSQLGYSYWLILDYIWLMTVNDG